MFYYPLLQVPSRGVFPLLTTFKSIQYKSFSLLFCIVGKIKRYNFCMIFSGIYEQKMEILILVLQESILFILAKNTVSNKNFVKIIRHQTISSKDEDTI